ncbi:hypothetical protein BZG36_04388 [Bifiguratus adelaidae]|uniref:non-specific serine/threonine protein kinase n=1 Tax=Bifiguratus adelaidae TaxID=1938954 RepID=A0A261XVG1_9FUNG|nr:hypothetical protein BZG36_04388 [Bifiguratus adelaidae]
MTDVDEVHPGRGHDRAVHFDPGFSFPSPSPNEKEAGQSDMHPDNKADAQSLSNSEKVNLLAIDTASTLHHPTSPNLPSSQDYFSPRPSLSIPRSEQDELEPTLMNEQPQGLLRIREGTSLSSTAEPNPGGRRPSKDGVSNETGGQPAPHDDVQHTDDIARFSAESLHSFSFSSTYIPANDINLQETRRNVISRSIDFMRSRFKGWKAADVHRSSYVGGASQTSSADLASMPSSPTHNAWARMVAMERYGWPKNWSAQNTPRNSFEKGDGSSLDSTTENATGGENAQDSENRTLDDNEQNTNEISPPDIEPDATVTSVPRRIHLRNQRSRSAIPKFGTSRTRRQHIPPPLQFTPSQSTPTTTFDDDTHRFSAGVMRSGSTALSQPGSATQIDFPSDLHTNTGESCRRSLIESSVRQDTSQTGFGREVSESPVRIQHGVPAHVHASTRFLPQNQALLATDAKLQIKLANDVASLVFGYANRELLGADCTMLVAEECRQKTRDIIQRRLDEVKYSHMSPEQLSRGAVLVCGKVIPIVRCDGSKGAASLWLKDRTDDSGNHVFTWIFEEIAEFLVRLAVTPSGTIQYIDATVKDLWGYSVEQVKGENIEMLVPGLGKTRMADSGFAELSGLDDDDEKPEVSVSPSGWMQVGGFSKIGASGVTPGTPGTPDFDDAVMVKKVTTRMWDFDGNDKIQDKRPLSVTEINRLKFFAGRTRKGAYFPVIVKINPGSEASISAMTGQTSSDKGGAKPLIVKIISIPTIAGLVTIHNSGLIQSCNIVFAKYLFGYNPSDLAEKKYISELLPQWSVLIRTLRQDPALGQGNIINDDTCRQALAIGLAAERNPPALSSAGREYGVARFGKASPPAQEDEIFHLSPDFGSPQTKSPDNSNASSVVSTPDLCISADHAAIIAIHRDGTEIEVQLQLRKVESAEEDLVALWITFDRAAVFAKYGQRDAGNEVIMSPSRVASSGNLTHMQRRSPGFAKFSVFGAANKQENDDEIANEIAAPVAQKQANIDGTRALLGSVSKHIVPVTPPLSSTPPVSMRNYSALTNSRSLDDYIILESLGQGAYGVVKLAYHKDDPSQTKVVIKYIIKSRILVDCWTRDRYLGLIPLEIHILHTLRRIPHPNIVTMNDYFEDEDHYYVEMNLHGNGMDLFDYIELNEGMSEREIKHMFRQIASAVQHLHKNGIVHRDIKDENVTLDEKGNAQLIDFGSAAYLKKGKKYDTFCGTLDYAAPEVLQGKKYEGPPQDIWALGILLYTLIYKENPFYNIDEIIARELQMPYVLCEDLIKRMLNRDVEKRPSIDQVLSHPWLTD